MGYLICDTCHGYYELKMVNHLKILVLSVNVVVI